MNEDRYVERVYIPEVGEIELEPTLDYEKALCHYGASYIDEVLYDRVKHETLMKLIDRAEYIYYFNESSNDYGRFLFIGLALRYNNELIPITFYGLGYHELRDKYLVDEWFFYLSNYFMLERRVNMSKEEIKKIIEQKRKELKEIAKNHKPSKRGILFSEIADLTDEDGALSIFEDLDLI